MNTEIGTLIIIVLGLAVLFKFMVSPFFYRRAILDKGATGSVKHALSSFVDFITFMLLLLLLALATSWLLLQYINSSGGSSFEELESYLNHLKAIDSFLFYWAFQTLMWSIVILLIILSIYSYKQGQKRFDKKLELAVEKDIQRLQEDMNEDRWENLPPNEEMTEMANLIKDYEVKIEEIKAIDSNDENIDLLEENIEQIKEHIQLLDVQRRLNIEVEDDVIEPKNKILTFFMSQGLMNSLQRTSFFFFILAMIIFIPLFVAVSSKHSNESVKAKIVQLSFKVEELKVQQSLDDLRVITQKNKIKESEITKEDETTLNELASSFENQFIRTRILSGVKDSIRSRKTLHTYSIKESILKQNAERSQYVIVARGEIPPVVVEALSLEEKALLSLKNEPITDIGKRFKDDLRKEVLLKDRKLWEHYKNLVKISTDSFQKPLTPKDLKGLAISNFLGDMGDVLDDVYRIESKRYMVALGQEKYMDNVLKNMSRVNFKPLPPALEVELYAELKQIVDNDELLKILRENPPSLSSVPEKNVKAKDLNSLIHSLAKQQNTLRSTTYANALASFDDYFPGKLAMEIATPMAEAMKSVSSLGGESSSASHTKTKNSFTRARSYGKLRGFSRIGGVLLGRMPSDNIAELDISDVKWNRVEDKLQIVLVQKDGKEIDLGLFNPAIVNLALAYASDGRATTVTMVTAEPLPDLKILLHPTLIDSGLGCQAIELDRIVDMTTSNNFSLNFKRGYENNKISNFEKLYKYSWALRLQSVTKNDLELQQALGQILTYAKEIIKNSKIDFPSISKSINFDFANKKTAFFDKSLIQNMTKCINDVSFSSCIENENRYMSIRGQSDFYELVNPIPQRIKTIEWSGVREQEYQIDKNFDFLKLAKHDELWPLRFMVQRVFISEATLAKNPSEYVDEPWEYLEINKMLLTTISKSLKLDKKTKTVIDNMREFTVIQRLFRLLLDDGIETNFSLKKLIELSNDTVKDVNLNVRTSRWNANSIGMIPTAVYERLNEEINKKEVLKSNPTWIKEAKKCMQFIKNYKSIEEKLNITQEGWENNCNFSTNGKNSKLDKYIKYLNSLRKLKETMGVFIDEKYNYENRGKSCSNP